MTSNRTAAPAADQPSFGDADLPVLFRSADQFAIRRQRHYFFLVAARYVTLALAAASGVASLRVGSSQFEWAALATIVLLLTTLGVEGVLRVSQPEDDWYDGRVLAESAKTLAWRYAVGARPFPLPAGQEATAVDTDRDAVGDREAATRRDFLAEVQSLLSDVPDIGAPPDAGSEITRSMDGLRRQPLDVRQTVYVNNRILDQQLWYARKAQVNRRHQSRLWVGVVIAEALALVLGGLRFTDVLPVDLVGVAVAVVAAATGWLGAKQYATLARSYSYAAQDLAIVRARLEAELDEQAWAAEAADAEEAISREHTLWRSSRSSRFNRAPAGRGV